MMDQREERLAEALRKLRIRQVNAVGPARYRVAFGEVELTDGELEALHDAVLPRAVVPAAAS